jgi:hypothetical protein
MAGLGFIPGRLHLAGTPDGQRAGQGIAFSESTGTVFYDPDKVNKFGRSGFLFITPAWADARLAGKEVSSRASAAVTGQLARTNHTKAEATSSLQANVYLLAAAGCGAIDRVHLTGASCRQPRLAAAVEQPASRQARPVTILPCWLYALARNRSAAGPSGPPRNRQTIILLERGTVLLYGRGLWLWSET